MKRTILGVAVVVLLAAGTGRGDLIYTLGNSLTQDTLPHYLDGEVYKGIYCGQNLQQIFNDPNNFCTMDSTAWDVAFANHQFDWVTVQPYVGTSMLQDASLIEGWMNMQPGAQFVIHTGWYYAASFETTYHGVFGDGMMHHNPAYFNALIAEVEAQTGRTVNSDHAIDVLETIYHDIEDGNARIRRLTNSIATAYTCRIRMVGF